MSEPRKICVDLYSECPEEPVTVADFIKWTNELRQSVPAEHYDDVMIKFGSDEDWDQPNPQLRIWYERPETPEEAEQRETQERRRAEERASQERFTLRSLLAKYPDEMGKT